MVKDHKWLHMIVLVNIYLAKLEQAANYFVCLQTWKPGNPKTDPQSTDPHYRQGPWTTPMDPSMDPSMDHPQNKIKNKNKDFTYSLDRASVFSGYPMETKFTKCFEGQQPYRYSTWISRRPLIIN